MRQNLMCGEEVVVSGFLDLVLCPGRVRARSARGSAARYVAARVGARASGARPRRSLAGPAPARAPPDDAAPEAKKEPPATGMSFVLNANDAEDDAPCPAE